MGSLPPQVMWSSSSPGHCSILAQEHVHALGARSQATGLLSCHPEWDVRNAKAMEVTTMENLTKEISMSCRFINSNFCFRSQYFQSTADQHGTQSDLDNPPEVPQDGRLQARRPGSKAALLVVRLRSPDGICEGPKSEHVTPQHNVEDRHGCEYQRSVLSLTEPVWTVLPW